MIPLDLVETKKQFFRKCGIPKTVGAVDGTLIQIEGMKAFVST